jgi:hypothetical protein
MQRSKLYERTHLQAVGWGTEGAESTQQHKNHVLLYHPNRKCDVYHTQLEKSRKLGPVKDLYDGGPLRPHQTITNPSQSGSHGHHRSHSCSDIHEGWQNGSHTPRPCVRDAQACRSMRGGMRCMCGRVLPRDRASQQLGAHVSHRASETTDQRRAVSQTVCVMMP